MKVVNVRLDTTKVSGFAANIEAELRKRIVGQDRAIEAIVEVLQTFEAEMNPPNKPVGNLLFLGPTGAGKTRFVEALAEVLFGDTRALTRIDCGEFQHSHEIAKLIGSPPGYLGHRETHPILTQEAINQWHTEKLQLSIILFDEIEKASDSMWQLLLGILDNAKVTLGDNRKVDMSSCIIFMTGNLGGKQIQEMLSKGLGFAGAQTIAEQNRKESINNYEKMVSIVKEAATRKFTPEFMNRIDHTVTFRILNVPEIKKVLEIELGFLQQRILQTSGQRQYVFRCTDRIKEFIFEQGFDPKYGARHLKRSIERNLTNKLSKLMATNQIKLGDLVSVDYLDGEVVVTKEAEDALVPLMLEKYNPPEPPLTKAAAATKPPAPKPTKK